MIPKSVLIAFPVMWMVALLLVYALRRPWRRLCEVYPFEGELPAEYRSRFTSGRIGWLRYRNGFAASADVRGVYLAMVFTSRRKRLFVPWDDIFIVDKDRFLEKTSKLTFRRMPEYPMELERSVVARLRQARP